MHDWLSVSEIGFALTNSDVVSTRVVLQVWRTRVYDSATSSINFVYEGESNIIPSQVIREALRILEKTTYTMVVSDNTMKEFFNWLNYIGSMPRLGLLKRANLRSEWNFFDYITRAFTRKCTNFDVNTQTSQQIGYSLITRTNFDFGHYLVHAIGDRIKSNVTKVYFTRFI